MCGRSAFRAIARSPLSPRPDATMPPASVQARFRLAGLLLPANFRCIPQTVPVPRRSPMKPFVRNLVLSAAVAATALAVVPSAHALDRRGRQVDQNTANLIGAGVIGLAAGVIVGSIVASTNDAPPHDRNPRPRPHQDRGFTTLLPADANQGYQNYGDY